MKRPLFIALFACALAFASTAAAGGVNIDVSLRAGYAMPFGNAMADASLDDFVAGAIPFEIDGDFLITDRWSAGLYFTYGFARIADVAKSEIEEGMELEDVSGHRFQRLGMQGIYRFSPNAEFAPWVGLGLGYEWTWFLEGEADGREIEMGLSGFEFAFQGGIDYDVSENLTLGPYATLSFGQFGKYKYSIEGLGDASNDINDKAMHEWLQLGLKATFSL